MQTTETRTLITKKGEAIIVSASDYDRASKHEWYTSWSGYPHNTDLGMKLHQFIMGPRPADIPIDYVIDHRNRKKLDASRSNLRWVSRQFNVWNVAKRSQTASRFVGLNFKKKYGKWEATCAQKSLGEFTSERDAAKAVAKEAIRLWGLWAIETDLLVGPGLLTSEEIADIQEELKAPAVVKEIRALPIGVRKRKDCVRYHAKYGRHGLGSFDTVEEAKAAYDGFVQDLRDKSWAQHLLRPIYRDEDGDAAIPLTGKNSQNHSSKCPEHLWHQLTFEQTWWYDGKYAMKYKAGNLHREVYRLLYPEWDGKLSIDHKDSTKKLDNRECNLRVATDSLQAYNKGKRSGKTSEYIGVSYVSAGKKWLGRITKDGVVYSLGCSFKTEHDAARALNAKAIELYGENARVVKILDEEPVGTIAPVSGESSSA